MAFPRLKTSFRVAAHMRRAEGCGAFAAVARKGDPDAGAVAVKVFIAPGASRLFTQSRDADGEPVWRERFAEDPATDREAHIDAWLDREISIDPDLWIVEIEDREGRPFLD